MNNNYSIWHSLFVALVLIVSPMKGVIASMLSAEQAVAHVSTDHCHEMMDHHDCLDEMVDEKSAMGSHQGDDCCHSAGHCCAPTSFFHSEVSPPVTILHARLFRHDSQFYPPPAFKPPRFIAA